MHGEDQPSDERSNELRAIDDCCDSFEMALRRGESPQLIDYFRAHENVDQSKLLRELLDILIQFKQRRGEPLDMASLKTQLPLQFESVIQEAIRDHQIRPAAAKDNDSEEIAASTDTRPGRKRHCRDQSFNPSTIPAVCPGGASCTLLSGRSS